MTNKLKKLLFLFLVFFISSCFIACSDLNSDLNNGDNSNVNPDFEPVRIKEITTASDSENNSRALRMRKHFEDDDDTQNSVETKAPINFVVIFKSEKDITFTIKLDNPEAYSIAALRITCDDPNSKIWLNDGNGGGSWENIRVEADGTSVIAWDSSNLYQRTYKIQTTSEDSINSFRIVDIRLDGHSKFQSKENGVTDLGNNELKIFKMDNDAFVFDIFYNYSYDIRFSVNIKEEYQTSILNVKIDGRLPLYDAVRNQYFWKETENKTVKLTYDYIISDYDITVSREAYYDLTVFKFTKAADEYAINYYLNEDDLYSLVEIRSMTHVRVETYRNSVTGKKEKTLMLFCDFNIPVDFYFGDYKLNVYEKVQFINAQDDRTPLFVYMIQLEDEDLTNYLSENYPQFQKYFSNIFTKSETNIELVCEFMGNLRVKIYDDLYDIRHEITDGAIYEDYFYSIKINGLSKHID